MQITYKKSTMYLKEEPLDIGYASEKVTLKDNNGNSITVGGQNGKTQLLISTAFIDENFLKELQKIEKDFPDTKEHDVSAYIIVANDKHKNPNLKNFHFLVDNEEEFSDFYGTKIGGAPYEDELTKAAILISKDGAIFYDEFKSDLEESFDTDTLLRKVIAAQTCYTGKGCH